MNLIDTETLRDLSGRPLQVGETVKALRVSNRVGAVYDFHGYICEVRKTPLPGRLEALVQPYEGGEAKWLGGRLIESLPPVADVLEGVLAEWS